MAAVGDRDRMAEDVGQALAALDATLVHFPKDVTGNLSPAEVALARVRNALIARLRAAGDPDQTVPVREVLDRVNLCLSLVLGMEYPQGGAKHPPLEQARELLNRIDADVQALPAQGPPHPALDAEPVYPRPRADQVSPAVGVPDRIRAAAKGDPTVSRRMALNVLIGAGTAAAAAVVGIPVVAMGLSPVLGRRGENWQPVGRLADFPVGGVTPGQVTVPRNDWAKGLRVKTVYVWRTSDTDAVVYSRNCTDASCPVVFDAGSDCFLCPCHGGIFLKDGTPIHGPPPRPLWRYAIRVNDGVLEIDLNSLPPMT